MSNATQKFFAILGLFAAVSACAAETAPEQVSSEPVSVWAEHESYDIPVCGDGVCAVGEAHFCAEDCASERLLCVDIVNDYPEAVHLPVQAQQQISNYSCWAAVTSAISQAYGQGASQCEILTKSAAAQGIDIDCCADPSAADCDVRGDVGMALQRYVPENVRTRQVLTTISEKQIIREIANGRPVQVSIARGEYHHSVVITGYDGFGTGEVTFHILDSDRGILDRSYEWIVNGYGINARWYASYVGIMPASARSHCK